MSGRKADHEQVVAMSIYLPNRVIAERLDISERQVTRILAKNNRSKSEPDNRKYNSDDFEDLMIKVLDRMGMSYGAIAYRFGLSRQAIEQKIGLQNER